MTEEKKKIVFSLRPLKSEVLKKLFQDNGTEIVNIANSENKYDFVLNFDFMESYTDFANIYQTIENSSLMLTFSKVKSLTDFFAAHGRGIFPIELIDSPEALKFLERFINKRTSTALKDIFDNLFSEYKTCKIVNHLNSGQITDLISMDIFDRGYNIIQVRNFLTNCIYYFSYLRSSEICGLPLEVEYATNDNSCVIQIVAPLSDKDFFLDYVLDSLQSNNSENTAKHLLYAAYENTHLLDIQYMKAGEKLIITGFWSKQNSKVKTDTKEIKVEESVIRGILFHNLSSHTEATMALKKKMANVTDALDSNIKELEDRLKDKLLPGDAIKLILMNSTEGIFKDNPGIFNEMVIHIVDQHSKEENAKALNEFVMEDIDKHLSTYPDQEIVKKMVIEEKEKILDFLKNDKALADMLEGLKKREKELATEVVDTATILNSLQEKLTKGTENIQEERQVVSGSIAEDKSVTKIGGTTEKIEETITKVSGSKEEKKDEKIVIKSGPPVDDQKGAFKFKSLGQGSADGVSGNDKVTVSSTASIKEEVPVTTIKGEQKIIKSDEAIKVKAKSLDPELLKKILEVISKELAKIPKGVKLSGLANELTQKIVDTLNVDYKMVFTLVEDAINSLQHDLAKNSINKEINETFKENEGSIKESKFLLEIKRKDIELNQAKKQIDILKSQLEAQRESQKQLREAKYAGETALKEQEQKFKDEILQLEKSNNEKKDFANEIQTGRVLTDRDAEKLKKAIDDSITAAKDAKEATLALKKSETAFTAQVNFLESEVRKYQKDLKNKEFMAEKIKESMNRALTLKDDKIKIQEDRINQLQDLTSKQAQSSDKDKIRALSDQLDNALKQAELYRRKLATATEGANTSKNNVNSEILEKELKKIKAREEKLAQTLASVNSEKTFLQSKMKELTTTLENKNKELKDLQNLNTLGGNSNSANSSTPLPKDAQSLKEHNVELERNIKEMTKKINDAQSELKTAQLKVKELEQKLKFASATASSDEKEKEKVTKTMQAAKDDPKLVDAKSKQKIQQLEKQMELLNDKLKNAGNELAESKKVGAKFKQELQAKNNEIDRLKKDLAKHQKKAA